jgi:choline dehydrogenase
LNEFDYIVVGGGTAGCVVAARLTESGRHRVLLLEAGGSDDRFFVRMPIGYGKCFHDPRVNWMYRSEPEAALNDRSGYWPRGKLLGGSGSINAMVCVRGLRQDYDDWAALGNRRLGMERRPSVLREDRDAHDGHPCGRASPVPCVHRRRGRARRAAQRGLQR